MEIFKTLLPAIVGIITVILPAWWLHKREIRKQRRENQTLTVATRLLDSLLNLKMMYTIRKTAERIFRMTTADRFLILIAFNGKTDFRFISVIYEEHQAGMSEYRAVERYNHIKTDPNYREMLREAERLGQINLDYDTMSDGMLKDFYHMEGVKHSQVNFLIRHSLDPNNDVIVYSSIASHGEDFSEDCKTFFKLQLEGVVVPEFDRYIKASE